MCEARWTFHLIAVLTLPLAAGCGAAGELEFSTRPINIMVPASPGGGWDQTGRALQAALSKSTGRRARVYNVPGAGGTVGLAQFVSDQPGDPHQLMVSGLVMLG